MNHDLFLLIRNRICQFYCQHTYQLCSLYPVLRSVSYGKLPFWNSLTVFRWKVTLIYQKVAVLWESYHFRVKVTVFEPNSWNRVLGWISRRTFSFSFSISSLNPIHYFVSYNSCQKSNQSYFFSLSDNKSKSRIFGVMRSRLLICYVQQGVLRVQNGFRVVFTYMFASYASTALPVIAFYWTIVCFGLYFSEF